MNYEKLKVEIKDIIEISQQVPEPFRATCFEILLTNFLASSASPAKPPKKPEADVTETTAEPSASQASLNLPGKVKAFLRKTNLTPQDVETIVMVEEGEFHFIKEPTHSNVAKGQSEWALLLALKNGILDNNLAVDPEAVRSIVQDKGFYDTANFAKNFKRAPYDSFFKKPLEPQGSPQEMSPQGEQELAALIKRLAA